MEERRRARDSESEPSDGLIVVYVKESAKQIRMRIERKGIV